MFNQVQFQNATDDASQAAEVEANVLYGASSDPTSDEPQAEVLHMFINTQTERDIIECNIEAEKDKIENNNNFCPGKLGFG